MKGQRISHSATNNREFPPELSNRLTGIDADGDIISTEEYSIIATRTVTAKEKQIIRKHIMEKLYAYENFDEEYCEWKVNSVFPVQINNPHSLSESENISTTKYCPCCGKKILIIS